MNIFSDLFIFEMANNHWGCVNRGLKIIQEFAPIARFNNIRMAVKLQIRDVDSFIHKDFLKSDMRYIKKTIETKLSKKDFSKLVKAIRGGTFIPMATPFDEKSVDLCEELGIEIIKIASSDINDWFLIEKVAKTRKPVVMSTGGSSLKDVDDAVNFFNRRNIPLAIMHCVSIYPTPDGELELNQIDFLRERYPMNIIGLSTHECTGWSSSIKIAYAKGARIFERHVDIDDGDYGNRPISPYCSLPENIDVWLRSYKKAVEMCGAPGTSKRIPPEKEIKYLDALVRGVYAKKDLPKGHVIEFDEREDDFYLAIPLQKGQISCRELVSGEVLLNDIKKDEPIMIDDIDSAYARIESLKELIYNRGI